VAVFLLAEEDPSSGAKRNGCNALAMRPADGMVPAFVEITPATLPPTPEQPVEGSIRIQLNGAEVTISGAASPAAIESVLRVVRESPGGKRR